MGHKDNKTKTASYRYHYIYTHVAYNMSYTYTHMFSSRAKMAGITGLPPAMISPVQHWIALHFQSLFWASYPELRETQRLAQLFVWCVVLFFGTARWAERPWKGHGSLNFLQSQKSSLSQTLRSKSTWTSGVYLQLFHTISIIWQTFSAPRLWSPFRIFFPALPVWLALGKAGRGRELFAMLNWSWGHQTEDFDLVELLVLILFILYLALIDDMWSEKDWKGVPQEDVWSDAS